MFNSCTMVFPTKINGMWVTHFPMMEAIMKYGNLIFLYKILVPMISGITGK